MPELPEVETMCRGILPLVGRQVVRAERTPCKRRPISISPRIDVFRGRIEGKTIVAVDRAGKRVVIWLSADAKRALSAKRRRTKKGSRFALVNILKKEKDAIGSKQTDTMAVPGEEAIVIEPRMTGLVLRTNPPTQEHLRFRMELADYNGKQRPTNGHAHQRTNGRQPATTSTSELLFWDRRGLGSVSLLSAEEYAAQFLGENRRLGPDALQLLPGELRKRLRHSRRPIKVALLDQAIVAGIGNLYASEILHVAGIHPATRCHRLNGERWARLYVAIHLVLEEAIYYEGSTLSDGTYRNALNEVGGYQNHHRVYDRAGEKCPTCRRGTILRIVQAQRSTFFCSHCQQK